MICKRIFMHTCMYKKSPREISFWQILDLNQGHDSLVFLALCIIQTIYGCIVITQQFFKSSHSRYSALLCKRFLFMFQNIVICASVECYCSKFLNLSALRDLVQHHCFEKISSQVANKDVLLYLKYHYRSVCAALLQLCVCLSFGDVPISVSIPIRIHHHDVIFYIKCSKTETIESSSYMTELFCFQIHQRHFNLYVSEFVQSSGDEPSENYLE